MATGRVAFTVATAVLVLVAIGLVVGSPWALGVLNGSDLDWARLSDIGQTYGTISAIVAAVALLGVVSSLIIQAREARAARLNAHRGYHAELMRMAMDDPRYMECWGPYLTETFDSESQFTYVNLIVSQWYAEYLVGSISDRSLRGNASSVFASVPGHKYWEAAGANWRDNYSGRRVRRFHLILDETYRKAVERPPVKPPIESSDPPVSARVGASSVVVGAIGGGVAAVIIVYAVRIARKARKGFRNRGA